MNDGMSSTYNEDFWEWDQATNVWTKKADYPGNSTDRSCWFFNRKQRIYRNRSGYGSTYYKDFWEWDQATNVWTKKADFAGMPRGSAVGFSIGNKGYIGTGSNLGTPLNDKRIFGNGTRQLMYGHRKPTLEECSDISCWFFNREQRIYRNWNVWF